MPAGLGTVQAASPDPAAVTPAVDPAAPKPDNNVVSLDDWRKAVAGSDEKVLSEVSRFKSLEDVGKELLRQKQELSKRAASGAFPEKGTPEQQAEWRKANGVPDAPTIEAYGVQVPEGYEISNVEKAALGALAERLHAKNVPAPIMAEITDTFFRAQAANQQMINELDNETDKSNLAQFNKEHGRDAENYLAAANALFEREIPDDEARNMILNARLPGGGSLKSNAAFMNLMTGLALKSGFGDRIEAGALESGGKSLATQHNELQSLMHTNPTLYNDPKTQEQLKKLISLRLARGEIDDYGNERKR